MKKYVFLFILIFPLYSFADELDCDNAKTTRQMNVCAGREVDAASKQLDEYLAKAKQKYSEEASVVDLLGKSQIAWLAYQKQYCDAIYDMWSGGTIRGVMFHGCMLKLTTRTEINLLNLV